MKIYVAVGFALWLFLTIGMVVCRPKEAVAEPPVVPAYVERLREAEERICNLEIQLQLLAEGERERAALLHGFETIGR